MAKKHFDPTLSLARGQEKVRLTLAWLALFHFSTLAVLAKRLSIQTNTTSRLLRKLKSQGLVQEVSIVTIRHKAFMLTQQGLTYHREHTTHCLSYQTAPSKINIANARHDLQVQLAVVRRLEKTMEIVSDRALMRWQLKKTPDALLSVPHKKIALEVELTTKTDKRIFIGYEAHAKAVLIDKRYDEVEYIFTSKSRKAYYEKRFFQDAWPAYCFDSQAKKWIKLCNALGEPELFYPAKQSGLVERFTFTLEKPY